MTALGRDFAGGHAEVVSYEQNQLQIIAHKHKARATAVGSRTSACKLTHVECMYQEKEVLPISSQV